LPRFAIIIVRDPSDARVAPQARVEQDRAVLFDAGLKTALAPTLERLDRLDLLLRGLAGQARTPSGAAENNGAGETDRG
jgi:hypothetical protein